MATDRQILDAGVELNAYLQDFLAAVRVSQLICKTGPITKFRRYVAQLPPTLRSHLWILSLIHACEVIIAYNLARLSVQMATARGHLRSRMNLPLGWR